ncbi:MAG: outer membrane lipoprotein carrier protein LolA, partial [Azospirillum brasilense]
MRRLLTILIAAPLLLAAKPLPWANHNEEIKRVEGYLTGLSTIVADFSQVAANGELSEGKFYLKRPGKMRWEYAPPTPILLVSNGKVITYYDAELDQVNYVPVDDTLAGFLAQDTIVLNS